MNEHIYECNIIDNATILLYHKNFQLISGMIRENSISDFENDSKFENR